MTREQEIAYLNKIEKVNAKGPYSADWASLYEMQVPEWFHKAKFGIFIHWGSTVFRHIRMNGTPEICI